MIAGHEPTLNNYRTWLAEQASELSVQGFEVTAGHYRASVLEARRAADGEDQIEALMKACASLWLVHVVAGALLRRRIGGTDLGPVRAVTQSLKGMDGELLFPFYSSRFHLKPCDELELEKDEIAMLGGIVEEMIQASRAMATEIGYDHALKLLCRMDGRPLHALLPFLHAGIPSSTAAARWAALSTTSACRNAQCVPLVRRLHDVFREAFDEEGEKGEA